MASEHAILTVKDVSELLQVAHITVYRLIREGRIPAFRIGHRLAIPGGPYKSLDG